MAGSSFGKHFQITTWGESHGKALGVVIDGIPAGLPISEEDFIPFLNRRRPGGNPYGTKRNEEDMPQILSGVFDGKTTGTPLSIMIFNTSQRSHDYSEIQNIYRPGHADYTFDQKYGFRDYRGGGRSSGRETVGRVAAGAVASKILTELGIQVMAYTRSIGPIESPAENIQKEDIFCSPIFMPNPDASAKAEEYIRFCMKERDSTGGVIECLVKNMPAGIGEPVFDKLDAVLAKAVMSIGAVKAVEIGDGILTSSKKGSENNDAFYMLDHKVVKKTNHSGGILGGISDGGNILVRAHIKPTPSIAKEQETVTCSGENVTVSIHGRHDPVIVPRAVVVVESMICIAILDLLMENMSSRLSSITDFYQ